MLKYHSFLVYVYMGVSIYCAIFFGGDIPTCSLEVGNMLCAMPRNSRIRSEGDCQAIPWRILRSVREDWDQVQLMIPWCCCTKCRGADTVTFGHPQKNTLAPIESSLFAKRCHILRIYIYIYMFILIWLRCINLITTVISLDFFHQENPISTTFFGAEVSQESEQFVSSRWDRRAPQLHSWHHGFTLEAWWVKNGILTINDDNPYNKR